MKTAIINGYYGTNNKGTILTAIDHNGLTYYAVKGSHTVNITDDAISIGDNVECVRDIDCYTMSKPINTINQLVKSIRE